MQKIKLFIEGFIIGLGKIIPGVSGAVFAMLFGVYELIIESLANPRNIIKNISKILPLGLGIIFAIIFGSNIISLLLEYHYVESMFFFIGIMLYSLLPLINDIKTISKTKKEIIISTAVVLLLFLFLNMSFETHTIITTNYFYNFISLFLCGILDALSTIIPGISGTAILMILGYYEMIINSIASLGHISLIGSAMPVLLPFSGGLVIGLIFISKLINYLYKRHESIMKMSIFGFVILSIIILIIKVVPFIESGVLPASLILLFLGIIITYLLENKLFK